MSKPRLNEFIGLPTYSLHIKHAQSHKSENLYTSAGLSLGGRIIATGKGH